MDIYETIYDTVKNNLSSNGMTFPLEKDGYLSVVCKNPFVVDEKELSVVESNSDFNTIFYRMLNRLPLEADFGQHQKQAAEFGFKGADEFRMYLILALRFSKEFRGRNRKLIPATSGEEIPKELKRKFIRAWIVISLRSLVMVNIVYPIWDSFSSERKNKIRRMFGRSEK